PDLPGPFTPAPLQGLQRYYGPVRPCASHRYSAACGCRRLRPFLSRPTGYLHPCHLADGIETTGSPVPCQRLRRAHATYTPDTARAASRSPPDSRHASKGGPSSRGCRTPPVSMSSFILSMRQQWFTHVRLLVAHLTDRKSV